MLEFSPSSYLTDAQLSRLRRLAHTCKAEVIAGLSSAQVHELHQRDPTWLTNGTWGVIQFVPGHA